MELTTANDYFNVKEQQECWMLETINALKLHFYIAILKWKIY
jgi:hypothetical protein